MTWRASWRGWRADFPVDDDGKRHFVVCSGGGPSIMEAANRGACDEGKESIGLNIVLPHEQLPNTFVTPDLSFQFHYFALRKMHFLLRARAVAVFPGGFGTFDEMFELLTLIQTGKVRPLPILLFGKRILGTGGRFRGAGRGRRDLARRPRPDPLVRDARKRPGTASGHYYPTEQQLPSARASFVDGDQLGRGGRGDLVRDRVEPRSSAFEANAALAHVELLARGGTGRRSRSVRSGEA